MSDLVVVGFNDPFKADEVLLKLSKLQRQHLIDLEDAAVVVRNKEGKVKIKQTNNLVATGAASGGLWGTLIGLLFLNPIAGMLVGAGTGAAMGALSDIGINDNFIKELGETIEPDSSALFVLVRKATPDKVLAELSPFKGKILRTSLSAEDEEELRKALQSHGEAAKAAAPAPQPQEARIDQELDDSFPASDPPSWTPVTGAGAPDKDTAKVS